MNSNIFNIEQEYLDIIDILEDNGGEVTPELEELLTINAENRDKKMIAYVNVIKQKQADIALAKDEIERLRNLNQSNERIIKQLKTTLLNTLEVFDLRNSRGNLYHKLPNAIMYAMTREGFNVKAEVVGLKEEELYKDVLDFAINSRLDVTQFEVIRDTLNANNIGGFTYVTIPSKDKFKVAINAANEIEDKEEREKRLELLDNLAELVENKYLTIR